jgi:hypothetical protein
MMHDDEGEVDFISCLMHLFFDLLSTQSSAAFSSPRTQAII